MKLLLTSSGISNQSIQDALTGLLGKSIAESNALFVPTGMYPFAGGPQFVWKAINGELGSPICKLGWKSLGIFELTMLPSIEKGIWQQTLREADALLVWGGDPVFLSHWLRESGLADFLPTLDKLVYVGVSAGAMATSELFAESYGNPPTTIASSISTEIINYDTFTATLVTARGAGFINFAIIPHYRNENHREASEANAPVWASKIGVPVYAIDEQTAVKVENNTIEVISEGHWELF